VPIGVLSQLSKLLIAVQARPTSSYCYSPPSSGSYSTANGRRGGRATNRVSADANRVAVHGGSGANKPGTQTGSTADILRYGLKDIIPAHRVRGGHRARRTGQALAEPMTCARRQAAGLFRPRTATRSAQCARAH
jgi:hypothetical protein